MCGIVGAIAKRPISAILLEGLKRLEYRGYDSAGVAILDASNTLQTARTEGKVQQLCDALQQHPIEGNLGIAHTRWATHGEPCERNAHPHNSSEHVAIVHNGIIENHLALKQQLQQQGYTFKSDTDSEVIAHLLHHEQQQTTDHTAAIQQLCTQLQGAYALGIIFQEQPNTLYAVRCGSPLVLGLGIEENFIASDPIALTPVTQRHICLEEGDIACLTTENITIIDNTGNPVERIPIESDDEVSFASKEHYRHFMQKEIYQQPDSVNETLSGHINNGRVLDTAFGQQATTVFQQTKRVRFIACGTSFHAALVASYWIETVAKIPCQVDIASEYRYRDAVVEPNTLFIALSQSGETADTLAALTLAKQQSYLATLSICNVPTSTLVRETDLSFITRAGTEIGVAATKTFTTQLIALLLLTLALAQHRKPTTTTLDQHIPQLETITSQIEVVLQLDTSLAQLAKNFTDKNSALYIARGPLYPIAMEGALKLKEISYLHAEAYAAGELKHGTLALVDENMPVVVLAPKNALFEKMCANIEEVRARGGQVYVISDAIDYWEQQQVTLIPMPSVDPLLQPLLYTIPLQLLAYYIAVAKGTDVDQPRNLAKSVTVE